jgi:hypothetical protein
LPTLRLLSHFWGEPDFDLDQSCPVGRAYDSDYDAGRAASIAAGPAISHQENAMKKLTLLSVTLGAALLAATPYSFHWSPAKTLSLALDTADARVGRPLTPGSVAGVNRRVHRRAYYGAAAGAAAVGAYGYTHPACGYHPYPPCY